MKKKQSEEVKRTHLTPEEYWKWRLSIEEMQHAETKMSSVKLTAQLMERETELRRLQRQLFSDKVKDAEEKVKAAKAEYEAQKEALEKALGISLNNSVIDEVTFEVKKLDD